MIGLGASLLLIISVSYVPVDSVSVVQTEYLLVDTGASY